MLKSIAKKFGSAGFLVGAIMAGNFLNFLFNAILGRSLSLEQFSVLTLISTLWFAITIFLNSISTAVNNKTAFLTGKGGEELGIGFRSFITGKSLRISYLLSFIWLCAIPLLAIVFHITDYLLFLSITPAIVLGTYAAISRGYFQGSRAYIMAGVIILSESVSKVVIAFIFINFKLLAYVYLSIPLSIAISCIVAILYVRQIKKYKKLSTNYEFPTKLLTATFLTIFSSVAFLSVDVLLARHFLSPIESGKYSLLSLVGKMMFFLGSLFNVFVLTQASHDTGSGKNSTTDFYKILSLNIFVLTVAFVGLGIFGHALVPMLFGDKSRSILDYLLPYTGGIALFTIANAIATYHLAKHQLSVTYNSVIATIIGITGIMIWHSRISDFIAVIIASSAICLVLNIIFHLLHKHDSPKNISEMNPKSTNAVSDIFGTEPLSVSICVPAYNEERNIEHILEALIAQKTNKVFINKIVVVSSGSTDRTEEIVNVFIKANNRISLIKQSQRNGKSAAINAFLKVVSDPIVVIESADTIPAPDTIELLCLPFATNSEIGMTGGAPIPVNDENTFVGYIIHTWWWFHRNIPRFGEIIAFRNILPHVSETSAVDEAYVQAKIIQLGLKAVHIDEAIVRNKGPENVRDLIKQRRRIFNGHSRLFTEEGVKIDNMTKSSLQLLKIYKPKSAKHFVWLIGGVLIEVYARYLGAYDMKVKKINPFVWDTAHSTKNVKRHQKIDGNKHALGYVSTQEWKL